MVDEGTDAVPQHSRSSSSRLRRTVATGAGKGKASVTLDGTAICAPAPTVANHTRCSPWCLWPACFSSIQRQAMSSSDHGANHQPETRTG